MFHCGLINTHLVYSMLHVSTRFYAKSLVNHSLMFDKGQSVRPLHETRWVIKQKKAAMICCVGVSYENQA